MGWSLHAGFRKADQGDGVWEGLICPCLPPRFIPVEDLQEGVPWGFTSLFGIFVNS